MLEDPTLPIVLSTLAGGGTLAVLVSSLRDPRRRLETEPDESVDDRLTLPRRDR